MTLHHLEIFAAVARHKSITRASEDLLISQPALTQQLKRLEEECNALLLGISPPVHPGLFSKIPGRLHDSIS